LCSSGSFYEHVNQIADELGRLGFKTMAPATADSMRQSGNYDIDAVKTWYKNPGDFHIKAQKHEGPILNKNCPRAMPSWLVKRRQNGKKSYIGPTAWMEMGLAFYRINRFMFKRR